LRDVLLVVVLLAAATGLGFWWRSRNGRYTPVGSALLQRAEDEPDVGDHTRLTATEIGAPLGRRATFVQFSSEVCTPCRRTAVVLTQLVAEHDDLSHVEMDVVEHLDLVRRFSIMRTPTILLLDARGVVVGRMSGATDRRHALTALEACPGGVPAP
jgi:thiol-disulfide isomerase/thioredoxin